MIGRKTTVALSLSFFLVSITIRYGLAADATPRFQARMYKGSNAIDLPYRLLVPANYNAAKTYPLILFLHGADERGNDNRKQLGSGLIIFSDDRHFSKYPCFIIAPQCPDNSKWVDADWTLDHHRMKPRPTAPLAATMELIHELEKEFSIDSGRIYIIGYSMGGFGAWEALQRWPELFAAAVPVCGGGDEIEAHRISSVPVWAFHGAHDSVVSVQRSRNMINAMIMSGGMPRYTEYPAVKHGSWVPAFNDPAMFEWLFKQSR